MAKLRQLDPNGITWHALSGYPKLENLALNPKSKTTSGTLDIWTNLATNPSFEAVSAGTTTVRRNLATAGFYALLSGNTTTYETGITWNNQTWSRLHRISTTEPNLRLRPPLETLSQGQKYVASFLVANRGTTPVGVGVDWCDMGTVVKTLEAGEIARIYSQPAVRTYDSVFRFTDLTVKTDGGEVLFKDAMIEPTDQQRPYFDGNTPDELGFEYGWEGTAGSSVSYAKATTTEVYRNNVNNPSFEVASGTVEVQRNLAQNPSFEVDSSRIGTANGATLERLAEAGIGSGYGMRVTCPNNGIGDSGAGIASQANIVAGRTYSYSVWVRAVTAGKISMYMGGNSGMNGERASTPELAAGETYRLSFTGQVATGTGTIGTWWVLRGNANEVSVFDVDKILVQQLPTLEDYFDGSTTAAGDFSYTWTGTAGLSESIQSAPRFPSAVVQGNTNIAFQSQEWSWSGKYSARVRPTSSGDFNTFIAPEWDSGTFRYGMQAGKTYTISCKIRLAAPLTGIESSPRSRQIAVMIQGWQIIGISNAAPNTAGVHTISLTVTIPVDATEAFVRIFNGARYGGGDMWVDDFSVVEGSHSFPYFDGSTPASGDFIYSWTGTENDSDSIASAVRTAGVSQQRAYGIQAIRNGERHMLVTPIRNAGYSGADTFIDLVGMVNYSSFKANTTYTLVSDITIENAFTTVGSGPCYRFNIGGKDMRSPIVGTTAGDYRIVWNFTIDSNAVPNFLRFMPGHTTGVSDVIVKNLLIVEKSYGGEYFDGSITAPAGITNIWSGTPHTSTSIQRVTLPKYAVSNTDSGAKFLRYQVTDPDGTVFSRYVAPKDSGTSAWRVAGSSGIDFSKIKAGKTYTLYIKHRANSEMRELDFIGFMDATAANKVSSDGVDVVVPSTWTTYKKTFVAAVDGTPATMLYIPMRNNNPPVDWVYDIAEWMLIEGDWPEKTYFDGSTPEDIGYFYSWTGTPDDSNSIATPK